MGGITSPRAGACRDVGMKQRSEGGGFAGHAHFRSHSVDIREPLKDFKLGKTQVRTSQNFRAARDSRGCVPLFASEENSQSLEREGTCQRLPSEVVVESRPKTDP